MLDLTQFQWSLAIVGATFIGISKTGLPGLGILIVPLMALMLPARESTGFVLPMLAMADIIAILYWRRHVNWRQLGRLLPWTWAGVIAGAQGMEHITNDQLKPMIGVLVLVLTAGSWLRERLVSNESIPKHWLFAALIGILAGSTSMLANAAGPIMIIYLVAMRFQKREFIGTQAWFFWILNLSKIPFSQGQGLITMQSFLTNLSLLPCIIVGAALGIHLANRLPEAVFALIVRLLALMAAIGLCVQ